MSSDDQMRPVKEMPPKAQRAVRIICIAMALMVILPVITAWLTGAFRF